MIKGHTCKSFQQKGKESALRLNLWLCVSVSACLILWRDPFFVTVFRNMYSIRWGFTLIRMWGIRGRQPWRLRSPLVLFLFYSYSSDHGWSPPRYLKQLYYHIRYFSGALRLQTLQICIPHSCELLFYHECTLLFFPIPPCSPFSLCFLLCLSLVIGLLCLSPGLVLTV